LTKDKLIEGFCRDELTRLFEQPGGRDVVADLQNPAVRRVSFDKFRAVLKSFRTPGQPFFTWDDIRYLHSLSTTEEFRSFCGD